jgi:hypothetical protein
MKRDGMFILIFPLIINLKEVHQQPEVCYDHCKNYQAQA